MMLLGIPLRAEVNCEATGKSTKALYAAYIKIRANKFLWLSNAIVHYPCLKALDKRENEKLKIVKVPGENNKHAVFMYAISTCAWCKRAKKFLQDNKIEYEYVDIDLCSREDREKIRRDILSRGGRLSYPTIIVDDKIMITGFQEHRIGEALQI